jgi:hypothetical protein
MVFVIWRNGMVLGGDLCVFSICGYIAMSQIE